MVAKHGISFHNIPNILPLLHGRAYPGTEATSYTNKKMEWKPRNTAKLPNPETLPSCMSKMTYVLEVMVARAWYRSTTCTRFWCWIYTCQTAVINKTGFTSLYSGFETCVAPSTWGVLGCKTQLKSRLLAHFETPKPGVVSTYPGQHSVQSYLPEVWSHFMQLVAYVAPTSPDPHLAAGTARHASPLFITSMNRVSSV